MMSACYFMSKQIDEACLRHASEFARQDRDRLRIGRISCFFRGKRQANFDHQAALRAIRYSDSAAVQAHGTIRDG
jgi:hypothetical protein